MNDEKIGQTRDTIFQNRQVFLPLLFTPHLIKYYLHLICNTRYNYDKKVYFDTYDVVQILRRVERNKVAEEHFTCV